MATVSDHAERDKRRDDFIAQAAAAARADIAAGRDPARAWNLTIQLGH